MAGLYLHIPFCKQACHYCDFHFSTNQEHRSELISAMIAEITLQKNYLGGANLATIYFGGGTPSILEPSEIQKLLDRIHGSFRVVEEPEITLEANPDDLTPSRLRELKASGINRLSIGIQSFDDAMLRFLNRAHTAIEATNCVKHAREAGFTNISVDLIYAIPGQPLPNWSENIEKTIALAPEHISAYALTIEDRTAFGQWLKKGKFSPFPEAEAADQFEFLMDRLDTRGYDHYEISNFCKPGFYSRHNTSYWQQIPYLGIGPSAHSYDGSSRQFTVSNNAQYVKALHNESLPVEREILTREDRINEYIFTSLRTAWGCNLENLKAEFGYDLEGSNKTYLSTLVEKEMATLRFHILTLTRKGKLVADQVASDLFVNPVTD